MMSALRDTATLQAISFVLFLVALPLVALGTMEDIPPLWWLGLLLIVVAGILPPAARYLAEDEEDEEDEKGDRAKDGAGPGEGDEDAVRPPEGPVGPPTTSPGRDLGRARVQEQRERADTILEETSEQPSGGDGEDGGEGERDRGRS
jgi:hypothetical protein